MGYKFQQADSVVVTQPVQVVVDQVHVVALLIEIPAKPSDIGEAFAMVTLSKGTGVGDDFVEHERARVVIPSEDLQPIMSAAVTSGKSRYQEIKEAVYGFLVAEGHLPAGTVE